MYNVVGAEYQAVHGGRRGWGHEQRPELRDAIVHMCSPLSLKRIVICKHHSFRGPKSGHPWMGEEHGAGILDSQPTSLCTCAGWSVGWVGRPLRRGLEMPCGEWVKLGRPSWPCALESQWEHRIKPSLPVTEDVFFLENLTTLAKFSCTYLSVCLFCRCCLSLVGLN